MRVYTKGTLRCEFIHPITDYPTEYGHYWVIRFNEETEEIETIKKVEFVPIDDEYPSMYDGWNDMQYEVEHPRPHIYYYWTEELKLI